MKIVVSILNFGANVPQYEVHYADNFSLYTHITENSCTRCVRWDGTSRLTTGVVVEFGYGSNG